MRFAARKIRSKLEVGKHALGVTIQLPNPDTVEIAGLAGLDYVWIDAEHGGIDFSDIVSLIRAADAVQIDSIVRVPDHSASFIQRVLDAGATGLMVPHVRTAEEGAALAAAARYAPEGVRGACPAIRSVGHLTTEWPVAYRRANQEVLVFGLIEDLDGVENVEAIAKSGLDGLVFGPFDLAQSLGLDGDITHPDIVKMHSRVVAAANDADIQYVGILGWDPCGTDELLRNSRIINITGDRGMLFVGFSQAVTDISSQAADLLVGADQ